MEGVKSKQWVKSKAIAAFFSVAGKRPSYADVRRRFLLVRSPAFPGRVMRVQVRSRGGPVGQ